MHATDHSGNSKFEPPDYVSHYVDESTITISSFTWCADLHSNFFEFVSNMLKIDALSAHCAAYRCDVSNNTMSFLMPPRATGEVDVLLVGLPHYVGLVERRIVGPTFFESLCR